MSQATDVSYLFAGVDTLDANLLSSWSGLNLAQAKTEGLVERVARLSGNLSQVWCRPGYSWGRARYTLVPPAGLLAVESGGWRLTAASCAASSTASAAAAATTPNVDSRASGVLGEYLELTGPQARRVGLRSLALYPPQPAGTDDDGALALLSEIHLVGSRDGGQSWSTVYKAALAPDDGDGTQKGWNIPAGPGTDTVIGNAFYSRFRFIFPAAYQRAAAAGCRARAAFGHLEVSLLEQEASCNKFESTNTPSVTPTPSVQVAPPVTTTTTSAPVMLASTSTTTTSTTSTTTTTVTASMTTSVTTTPTPSVQATQPVTTSASVVTLTTSTTSTTTPTASRSPNSLLTATASGSLTPLGSPNAGYCALPNNGGCGPNGVCSNTPGGAGPSCTCAPGYVRAGAQELTSPDYLYGWQVQVSGGSAAQQQQARSVVDGLASTHWNSGSNYGQASSGSSGGFCNFPASILAPVTVAANGASYAGAYVNFNQTWGNSARIFSVSVISNPALITPNNQGGCTDNAGCPSHSAVSELVVLGSSNGGVDWTYLATSGLWSGWAPEQSRTLTLDPSLPATYNAYRFVILRNFHWYSIYNFMCSSSAILGDLRVTLDVPSCELPSQTPSPSLTNTPTPTSSASATPTPSPSLTASATRSSTVSLTPTCSATPSPTLSLYSSRSNTPTPSRSVTASQSATPTNSATPSCSFTQTMTPTRSPSATQTGTPTISVTPTQTVTPTASPSVTPTQTPYVSNIIYNIGASSTNSITLTYPYNHLISCPNPVNKANWGPYVGTYSDTFAVSFTNNYSPYSATLTVRRTDNTGGWGLNLQFTCRGYNLY